MIFRADKYFHRLACSMASAAVHACRSIPQGAPTLTRRSTLEQSITEKQSASRRKQLCLGGFPRLGTNGLMAPGCFRGPTHHLVPHKHSSDKRLWLLAFKGEQTEDKFKQGSWLLAQPGLS